VKKLMLLVAIATLAVVLVGLYMFWPRLRPAILEGGASPNVIGGSHPLCVRASVIVHDPLHLISEVVVAPSTEVSKPKSTALVRSSHGTFEGDVCLTRIPTGPSDLAVSARTKLFGASLKGRNIQLFGMSMPVNLSMPASLDVLDMTSDGHTILLGETKSETLPPSQGSFAIDIASMPIPSYSIDEYIKWSIRYDELLSERDISIPIGPAKELVFRSPAQGSVLKQTLIYFKHDNVLFKCFLVFHDGDVKEPEYLRTFLQTVGSIKVPA